MKEAKDFVHLHTHSEYSLLEACGSVKGLVKRAAANGMSALALTDNGNLFGAIEFYFECKKNNIKPIIGLDAFLAPQSRLQKGENKELAQVLPTKLVLLAQNNVGYTNLCALSTIGYQEGFYYRPRIDVESLEKYNEGLIALSGGLHGDISTYFQRYGAEKAIERIQVWHRIFQDRFYLEICRTGRPEQEPYNKFLLQASSDLGISLVATNDIHYLNSDDSMAQEVLVCIGTNRTLQDESRFRLGSDQFYLKESSSMHQLFSDIPESVENALKISQLCNVEFHFKDESGKPIYHLPQYPVPEGATLEGEMERLAKEGLQRRLKEAEQRGEPILDEALSEYQKRLDYEVSVISKMGFIGYFLIVQDFIGWAKEHDIPVGPGRGSGAGSLVAYSLGITDLDPMKYNLIFERFLNPERISMPDFDVDFCQDRRQEVIEYVNQKYGRVCVSQIITFGKLKAKAAIRDVGRVLAMTFTEVDVIAKLIPDKLGITLKDAIEMESRLRDLMENDPKINTLMELALKIEGLSRHASIHAAGVIISNKALVEYAPLYKGEGQENIIQYDMKHAEKIGLIKFDFLGLKTLTLIHHAFRLIQKNRGKSLSTKDISLSDPSIYKIMSCGDTAGIFQFEGEGISDLIQRVQPTCFEDITAINALYRPGPMQMLDEYIGRKHGKTKVTYLFDELEPILKETYGIIVYQEQVQLIAARIASYSLGEADLLRRAMGKKIASEMDQQRGRFLEGAKENGHDLKKSEELFDLMAKFAEYGFNKSHAAAYCVVAAQTAWLKAYYPVEFFAAMFSTEMSDTDKVVEYIKDARRHSIEVKAPHINWSEHKFSVKEETIYFGLGAIKGVGESAVQAILEARGTVGEEKPFASLDDFFTRVDMRRVNKKVIECLIKAGALDGFGYHRAQLINGYSKLLESVESKRRDMEIGQVSLFDSFEEEETKIHLDPCPEWSKSQRLAAEKEVLGFYLSQHPLDGLEKILSKVVSSSLGQLGQIPAKTKVRVGGVLGAFREVITKKGTRMAFGQLEDQDSSIELVVFPEAYLKFQNLIKSDGIILVEGILEKDEQRATHKILVDQMGLFDEHLQKAKKLILRLKSKANLNWPVILEILESHQGDVAVDFELELTDIEQRVSMDGGARKVRLSADLIESLQQHLQQQVVEIGH